MQSTAAMSLFDLQPELFVAIIGSIDLCSTIRLARTCRAFAGLAHDHRHFPLYSAVRANDLNAFHRAVRAFGIPQRSMPGIFPSEREEHLCQAVVACVWVLAVCRDCTAVEWWAPLGFILGSLTPYFDDHRFRRYDELPEKPANRVFARVVYAVTARSHMELLDCLRKFKDAAPSGWLDLDSSSDWMFLPNVIMSVINNYTGLWTRNHQLHLLPVLLDISGGVSYLACIPEDNIIGALVATQDLALIVTFVVEQNRFRARFGSIDSMTLLAALDVIDECGKTFDILVESYLAAIGPCSSATATFIAGTAGPNVTFPSPINQVRTQLAQTYAFAGLSSKQFMSFMGYLQPSPFVDGFIPWLLACDSDPWPKQYHDLKSLSWLVTHAHLHVSMIHALPLHRFDYRGHLSVHSPATLNLVLTHIPLDLAGLSTHAQSPAGSHANMPFCTGAKCNRCRALMRAASERAPTEPLLSRFASGEWHVSYAPIPRDVWLAEARAVAALIRDLQPVSSSAWMESAWMDWVDWIAPALVPLRVATGEGKVDWFGVRDKGINALSVSAAILGSVYEERVAGVDVRAILAQEQAGHGEPVDWTRILDCVQSQVGRLQAKEVMDDDEDEARQEMLAIAARLVRALWDRCGKWMSEHPDFVEWAFAAEE